MLEGDTFDFSEIFINALQAEFGASAATSVGQGESSMGNWAGCMSYDGYT